MASKTLGQRLLLARRDVDITQTTLAAQVHISPQYISDLERGKSDNPALRDVEALARALGIRPEYLAGWSDDPLGEDRPASIAEGRIVYQVTHPAEYHLVQELLDLFPELTREDQDVILQLAHRLHNTPDRRIIE